MRSSHRASRRRRLLSRRQFWLWDSLALRKGSLAFRKGSLAFPKASPAFRKESRAFVKATEALRKDLPPLCKGVGAFREASRALASARTRFRQPGAGFAMDASGYRWRPPALALCSPRPASPRQPRRSALGGLLRLGEHPFLQVRQHLALVGLVEQPKRHDGLGHDVRLSVKES